MNISEKEARGSATLASFKHASGFNRATRKRTHALARYLLDSVELK